MSFTDQKPRIVTESDLKLAWGGEKNARRFRCYLCGYTFKVGDIWRWVYTNSTPGAGGNPLVCENCDGPRETIIERWAAMHREAKARFWWFAGRVGL